MLFDQFCWLPDNLLLRSDAMTMAASIELRMPYLDRALVEYVASIPRRMMVRGVRGKIALRESMSPVIPPEVARRSKRGFQAPFRQWSLSVLRPVIEDLLLNQNSKLKAFVDLRRVQELLNEHANRIENREKIIWSLVALEFVSCAPQECEC